MSMGVLLAENKPTTVSDARAAVEAKVRTSAGKAFDEKFGTDFGANHLGPLHQCKQSTDGDMRSFWILMKLDQDGRARELLLYPETKLGACAREALLRDKFVVPPRPEYWVSVSMKLAN
jgi:hypothetical protein